MSDRSGRKPPAEGSALYIHTYIHTYIHKGRYKPSGRLYVKCSTIVPLWIRDENAISRRGHPRPPRLWGARSPDLAERRTGDSSSVEAVCVELSWLRGCTISGRGLHAHAAESRTAQVYKIRGLSTTKCAVSEKKHGSMVPARLEDASTNQS